MPRRREPASESQNADDDSEDEVENDDDDDEVEEQIIQDPGRKQRLLETETHTVTPEQTSGPQTVCTATDMLGGEMWR